MSFALEVKTKLDEYNELMKQKPITLAATLDPRIKSFLGHIGINTDQIKTDLVEEWNLVYERSYKLAAFAYTDPSTSKGVTAETSSFLSLQKRARTAKLVRSHLQAKLIVGWPIDACISIRAAGIFQVGEGKPRDVSSY
jgi:hypothetical protein